MKSSQDVLVETEEKENKKEEESERDEGGRLLSHREKRGH